MRLSVVLRRSELHLRVRPIAGSLGHTANGVIQGLRFERYGNFTMRKYIPKACRDPRVHLEFRTRKSRVVHIVDRNRSSFLG